MVKKVATSKALATVPVPKDQPQWDKPSLTSAHEVTAEPTRSERAGEGKTKPVVKQLKLDHHANKPKFIYDCAEASSTT